MLKPGSVVGRTSCVLELWLAWLCSRELLDATESPPLALQAAVLGQRVFRAFERGAAVRIYLIFPAASLSRCICMTLGSPRTAFPILPWDIIDRFHSDPFKI